MKFSVLGVSALALAMVLTSCIDDNYNLTDIDTTMRLQVKDLTIPVNLDPIQLSSFIKEGEELRILNGEYAVQVSGEFSSGDINVDPIVMSSNIGSSEYDVFETGNNIQTNLDISLDVALKPREISFSIESGDVPEQILGIEAIYGSFSIDLDFEFTGISSSSSIVLHNAVLKLPKGIITDEPRYDRTTGLYTITEEPISDNNFNIHLECTGIDYAASGASFDPQSHTALFDGLVGMESGTLTISDKALLIPASIGMTSSYKMSDITVDSFSGDISYEIEGVDITDVDLSGLPDLLTQENTLISIVNPQLYLSVNNPLYTYGLTARSGLSITKHFAPEQGTQDVTYSSDVINLASTASSAYLLAPDPDAVKSFLPGYSDPAKVRFPGLSDILAGNGIPKYLSIQLENPMVPEQHVNELKLGTNMGAVTGTYEFVAPLQFGAGTMVTYTTTQDGWKSDDLDNLTIETLGVSAIISTNVPFGVDVKAYPLDKDGKRIDNVEITGAHIAPNCSNAELNVQITGEIRNLDGIEIIATGFVDQTMTSAISPSQTITCSQIRATVSGYYDTEL